MLRLPTQQDNAVLCMIFDAAICFLIVLAVVFGFRSGLLRSLATILGYLLATAVAVGTAPAFSLLLARQLPMPPVASAAVLFGILLVCGMIFGWLLRRAVGDMIGPRPGTFDRIAGATLGAVRILLIAVLLVVVFDRIIPPGRDPGFLKGSQLRPYLSFAGRMGLRSLPPDVAAQIDKLKRARGI